MDRTPDTNGWIPPAAPTYRIDAGTEWVAAWDLAHREMRPWNRMPSVHLIDRILGAESGRRSWLVWRFAWLAGVTTAPDGETDRHDPLRTIWWRETLHPVTLRPITVRVVLDADGITILTAIPQ